MKRRVFLAAGLAAALAWEGRPGRRDTSQADAATRSGVVAKVIAYAAAQAGKPYLWGGTGPGSFDCSGLVYEAYAHAGISIPRRSQDQWAAGPRVASPQAGDLVFFAGADGTREAPGHVGLVVGEHQMIQAYAPGVPVGAYPFGVPSALDGTGPGTVIGYTRPWA